ncbi:hypothetical protein Q644_03925 [Brucella intermedia 229E]|uniref:Uncharacterized protein n=1 Tax=Brucella intermedia 229E TaxID=1337887 RepID=U4VDD1_9HYPH|nr:hypothetical protein Q644_03925 [Brucella intermedia 229E]
MFTRWESVLAKRSRRISPIFADIWLTESDVSSVSPTIALISAFSEVSRARSSLTMAGSGG